MESSPKIVREEASLNRTDPDSRALSGIGVRESGTEKNKKH